MANFVAALPMYDWPETADETDAAWGAIRERLRAAGVSAPERLARRNADLPAVSGGIRDAAGRLISPDPAELPPEDLDFPTLFRHPALLLAQTCWGPMEQGLSEHVTVLGQPDYSAFEGGEGPLYSSAILMRGSLPSPMRGGSARSAGVGVGRSAASPPPHSAAPSDPPHKREGKGLRPLLPVFKGKRFAFNGLDSMSGFIALERDLEAAGGSLQIFSEQIESGAHRASIVAVADGRADVCAVDCRTWDLARRFEPCAERLQVVGWTAKRLGLPFITSRLTPPETVAALREALQATPSSLASSG